VTFSEWIGFIALILSLYVLWQVRQFLLLTFAAVTLATILNLLVRRLQRWNIPRSLAVVLSLLIFFTVFIGFFWLLVPPFASQLQELAKLLLGDETRPSQLEQQLKEWIRQLSDILSQEQINNYINIEQLSEQLPNYLERLAQQLQPLFENLWERGISFLSGTFGVVFSLLLVFVLTIMFLAQPLAYRRGFIRLFPSFYRRRVDEILDLCEEALTGWLLGILVNMTVIAVFSWLGLSILRVDLALAHGILAGLLTFIPNIGPTLSVIPPFAIALLDSPLKAIGVFILYVIIQQMEGNFLTPYVMAQQVSLLPAVTLLAQVFFATFFGFLGLLLALPLAVVAQVWLQECLIKDILDRWQGKQHHLSEVSDIETITLPTGDTSALTPGEEQESSAREEK
jgi:predicted PurR-regulated permease PerM